MANFACVPLSECPIQTLLRQLPTFSLPLPSLKSLEPGWYDTRRSGPTLFAATTADGLSHASFHQLPKCLPCDLLAICHTHTLACFSSKAAKDLSTYATHPCFLPQESNTMPTPWKCECSDLSKQTGSECVVITLLLLLAASSYLLTFLFYKFCFALPCQIVCWFCQCNTIYSNLTQEFKRKCGKEWMAFGSWDDSSKQHLF